jgi:hypothetical protein
MCQEDCSLFFSNLPSRLPRFTGARQENKIFLFIVRFEEHNCLEFQGLKKFHIKSRLRTQRRKIARNPHGYESLLFPILIMAVQADHRLSVCEIIFWQPSFIVIPVSTFAGINSGGDPGVAYRPQIKVFSDVKTGKMDSRPHLREDRLFAGMTVGKGFFRSCQRKISHTFIESQLALQ